MNRMRQVFQRGGTEQEVGAEDPQVAVDVEAARHGAPLTAAPINLAAAATDPAEQLRAFRKLVGISKEPSGGAAAGKGSSKANAGADDPRPAENVGLYGRVVHSETAARRGFTFYSLIINGALGVQVVVAAALTAMGAGNVNHTAITVFGAVNTVIAGFLTYLKGSGLPGRLKYYENSWRKVRESIEQRERDFASAATFGTPLPAGQTLEKAVADIEKLYKDTRTDIEVNTPDNYTALSKQGGGRTPNGGAGSGSGSGSGSAPTPQPNQPVLPPGTAPELRRGDFQKGGFDAAHADLAYPEKAHARPSSASTDATAHRGADQE